MSTQNTSYFDSLIRWGNWCGPGFSAGQIVGPGPVASELLAVGGIRVVGRDGVIRQSLVDLVCKEHDRAIGDAEGRLGERQKTLDADLTMLRGLAEIFQTSRFKMSALEESYAVKAAVGFAYKIYYYNIPTAVYEDARDWLKSIIGTVRLSDGTPGSDLVDRVFAANGFEGLGPIDLANADQIIALDSQSSAQFGQLSGHSLHDVIQVNPFLTMGVEGLFGSDGFGALVGLDAGIDASLPAAWSQSFSPYGGLSAGMFGEAWISTLPALSDVVSDDSQLVNVIGALGAPQWTDVGWSGGISDNGNPLSAWEGQASGLGGSAMAEAYRIMQRTLDSYSQVSEV